MPRSSSSKPLRPNPAVVFNSVLALHPDTERLAARLVQAVATRQAPRGPLAGWRRARFARHLARVELSALLAAFEAGTIASASQTSEKQRVPRGAESTTSPMRRPSAA